MTDKKLASINDFLTDDTEYVEVTVFKKLVRLRTLTSGDLIEFREANQDKESQKASGLRLIIKSVVDADGKQLFGEEHIATLRKRPEREILTLLREITKLNQMGKDADGDTAKND